VPPESRARAPGTLPRRAEHPSPHARRRPRRGKSASSRPESRERQRSERTSRRERASSAEPRSARLPLAAGVPTA
jgi:hypothetical protein